MAWPQRKSPDALIRTEETATREQSRPGGPVILAHAMKPEHVVPLCQLAERLQAQNPDCTILLSRDDDAPDGAPDSDQSVVLVKMPVENAASIDAFLDNWRPDFVLWTAGNLRPIIVDRVTRRNIPLGLIAAEADLLPTSNWLWFKGAARTTLNKLNFVFTLDAASFRHVESMKLETVDVAFGGPLLENAVSLPYNEAEREEMATLLLGRQAWLAAHVTEQELPAILDAHRQVIRYSHRAVLIVVPDARANPGTFLSAFEESALRTVRWSEGETPEEATQIVFADVEDELGLWYRVAPISFMGNSLFPGMTGSDPNEPAAHGSAILHGPHLGYRAASYARFTEAAAARQVADATALATAVARLMQPDQCASMAHTAWEVASRGAVLTDMVADRVLDQIERIGSRG